MYDETFIRNLYSTAITMHIIAEMSHNGFITEEEFFDFQKKLIAYHEDKTGIKWGDLPHLAN